MADHSRYKPIRYTGRPYLELYNMQGPWFHHCTEVDGRTLLGATLSQKTVLRLFRPAYLQRPFQTGGPPAASALVPLAAEHTLHSSLKRR